MSDSEIESLLAALREAVYREDAVARARIVALIVACEETRERDGAMRASLRGNTRTVGELALALQSLANATRYLDKDTPLTAHAIEAADGAMDRIRSVLLDARARAR